MWAALLAQVFYLQESKRCKQRGCMCEFSVCFHDEQKVCGDDFFHSFQCQVCSNCQRQIQDFQDIDEIWRNKGIFFLVVVRLFSLGKTILISPLKKI